MDVVIPMDHFKEPWREHAIFAGRCVHCGRYFKGYEGKVYTKGTQVLANPLAGRVEPCHSNQ